MGLAANGGLQSGGGGPASSLSPNATGTNLTLSGISTALQFVSTQVSGSDAYKATTGARWHIGGGATDYASSDGTTVTFAGPIAATTSINSTGDFQTPANGAYYLNGGLHTAFMWYDSTDVELRSPAALKFNAGIKVGTTLSFSPTAPTISAGFGAGASVTAGTSVAFTINLGAAAQVGTIGFPAATTGWIVSCTNITNNALFVISQTGGTTTTAVIACYSRTTGLIINWTASDVMRVTAVAY